MVLYPPIPRDVGAVHECNGEPMPGEEEPPVGGLAKAGVAEAREPDGVATPPIPGIHMQRVREVEGHLKCVVTCVGGEALGGATRGWGNPGVGQPGGGAMGELPLTS